MSHAAQNGETGATGATTHFMEELAAHRQPVVKNTDNSMGHTGYQSSSINNIQFEDKSSADNRRRTLANEANSKNAATKKK